MHFKAEVMRGPCDVTNAPPLGLSIVGASFYKRIAPGPNVNLDCRRPKACRGFDLAKLGGDEQRYANAGIDKLRDRGRQQIVLGNDVEPALGGALGALLWNEARGVRLRLERNCQHLGRRRHLEIERRELGSHEPSNIVVGDVTAILAQMGGDVVGASLDRELGSTQGIGVAPSPRIAERRHVIDVDAEADGRRAHAVARACRRGGRHGAPRASRPDLSSSSRRRRC